MRPSTIPSELTRSRGTSRAARCRNRLARPRATATTPITTLVKTTAARPNAAHHFERAHATPGSRYPLG